MEITSVLIGSDPWVKRWLQCSRLFPLVEIFFILLFFVFWLEQSVFLVSASVFPFLSPKRRGEKNNLQNFEAVVQIGFLYQGIPIPLDGNFPAFQDYQRKAAPLNRGDVAGHLAPGNWFSHDKLVTCPNLRCWSCVGSENCCSFLWRVMTFSCLFGFLDR